ncbi:MAG: hypothetical protein ACYC0X_23770 [Pirellulaceae bacterium]
MEATSQRYAWTAFLLASCVLGCGPPSAHESDLGALPRLRESPDPQLRDELARLVAEHATPELLEASEIHNAAAPAVSKQAGDTRNDFLSPAELAALLTNLDRVYPIGAFRFGSKEFATASRLRAGHRSALERYRARIAADNFRFQVALTAGLVADLSFLDQATAMHRLEAVGVAEALRANKPGETILPLRNMFRIDKHLADLKHVVSRLTAAELRGETLRAAEAVAGHPQATAKLLHLLLQLVNQQLTDWPSDADAWIGDRAMGLHAYEMVREGQLLSLLTVQEIRKLGQRQEVDAFTQAVTNSLDSDELFYLQSMRSIIDSCSQPYYQRQPAIAAVAANLDQLRDTPHYPLFAAQVLLVDLGQGLRLQALDRARCEAFSMALSAATGSTVTPLPVNPLTGNPFDLVPGEAVIEVRAIDGQGDGESFQIPRPSDSSRDNPRKSG